MGLCYLHIQMKCVHFQSFYCMYMYKTGSLFFGVFFFQTKSVDIFFLISAKKHVVGTR